MKRFAEIYTIAAFIILAPSGLALAQTASSQPTSSNVAQQFKTGANHVSGGAVQIGQGIKQGAILTWEAMQAGAASFASKFSGNGNSSPPK